jgi:hypothetical protein
MSYIEEAAMKKLTLRVPDDLQAELAEWAKREHRSVHAQILWIVQQALEAEKERPRLPHTPSFVENVKASLDAQKSQTIDTQGQSS